MYDYKNDTLICIDDFLPIEDCEALIKMYEENVDKSYVYDNTFPVVVQIHGIERKLISDFHLKFNLDKMEIVKRYKGSYMDAHVDKTDKLAFIIYLNDDYDGGETFIGDITINPKRGRLVLFSNGSIKHGVNLITEGTRYILIGWFI